MNLADHIDNTLRAYAESATYRAALHAEQPGALPGTHGICPPEHPHSDTTTCYSNHGCRCDPCRAASSKRQKQARFRRARAAWGTKGGKAA
jgi:hypothetical protein